MSHSAWDVCMVRCCVQATAALAPCWLPALTPSAFFFLLPCSRVERVLFFPCFSAPADRIGKYVSFSNTKLKSLPSMLYNFRSALLILKSFFSGKWYQSLKRYPQKRDMDIFWPSPRKFPENESFLSSHIFILPLLAQ